MLYSLAPTMVDIENTEQPETTDRQKYNEMKQEELKISAEKYTNVLLYNSS
jgi:hypothetical protein